MTEGSGFTRPVADFKHCAMLCSPLKANNCEIEPRNGNLGGFGGAGSNVSMTLGRSPTVDAGALAATE